MRAHASRGSTIPLFMGVAALSAGYVTSVFYPGVLYTDSYMRWDMVLSGFRSYPMMSIGPSLWMWLAYRLTNNFAAFTLLQSFAFFMAVFVLLQKFTRLQGPWALATAVPVLSIPLFQGYSVFHESGVLAAIATGFLLVLTRSTYEMRSLPYQLVHYGSLLLCLFTIFSCRLNALTILPVLVYLFVKRVPRSKRVVAIRLSILLAGVVGARSLPYVLRMPDVDVGAFGVAWETLQVIKRTNNPAYDHYLDYAGNTKVAMANVDDTMWVSFFGPNGMVMDKLLDRANARRIGTDYVKLAIKEPKAFLENKVRVIGRVMGFSQPLGFYEFDEDRLKKMHEFGCRQTPVRHQAFETMSHFMNQATILCRPWLMFLVGLALLVVDRLCLDRRTPLLATALTLAGFYYLSFWITAQSYEFRYFFPSAFLIVLATIGVLTRILIRWARSGLALAASGDRRPERRT